MCKFFSKISVQVLCTSLGKEFLMNRHFFLASNFRDISTNSSYAVFPLMYFKSFINISWLKRFEIRKKSTWIDSSKKHASNRILIKIMPWAKARLVYFLVLGFNHDMGKDLYLNVSVYKWQMSCFIFGYIASLVSGNTEICFKISSSSDMRIQSDTSKITFLRRKLDFKPNHCIEIILVSKPFDKLLLHIWWDSQ